MRRRIVTGASRPLFWMSLLLVWVGLSALRSWHTSWSSAALTESLRWSAGIGLALTLSLGLKRTALLAQMLAGCLVFLILTVISDGAPKGFLTGPFGDHQLCASAILVLLPFSLAVGVGASRASWRWAGQIVALAAGVCLILTETRSAWAGAAVGGCVFFILWMLRSRRTTQRWPVYFVPIVATVGVVFSFLWIIHTTEFANPLAARAATLGSLAKDGSWQWRLETWHGVARMISMHPWIGWGIGHYAVAHWTFTHLDMRLLANQRPTLSDQAHDLYLQTAADLGLVGLFLYLATVLTSAWAMMRALFQTSPCLRGRHGTKLREALLVAGISLVTAQMIDAIASPSWQFAEVSFLYWIGLGLALASCSTVKSETEEEPIFTPRIRRRLQYVTAGLAVVLLAAQIVPLGRISPVLAAGLDNPHEDYAPTLQSLLISGPTSMPKYPLYPVTEIYTATATYSDGSTANVTKETTFSTNSGVARFSTVPSESNIMTIPLSAKGSTIIITGKYTEGSVTDLSMLSFPVPY